METSPNSFRQNIFNRAKSIFHHLRWFFCLSTQENDRSDTKIKTQDQKVNVNPEDICLDILPPSSSLSFTDLPIECKLKIFSNLSTLQRGLCRQVCSDWCELIRASCLWKEIDLTCIKFICNCHGKQPNIQIDETLNHQLLSVICKSQECYDNYKTKLRKFIDFISDIKPYVRLLKFSFDLIDCTDDWVEMLQNFLRSIIILDLQVADIDWTKNPFCTQSFSRHSFNGIDTPGELSNSIQLRENQNDLSLKQRRRNRRFEYFFDTFTLLSCRLKHLILPFEWTEKSVKMLCKLKKLKSLTLLKCQNSITKLELSYLDSVLASMSNLKHLKVEADLSEFLLTELWSPVSNSLVSLDMRNCSCVNLIKLDMPNLTNIKLAGKVVKPHVRNQQRGNEFVEDEDDHIMAPACLYEVLKTGAPNLKSINEFKLGDDWRCVNCTELDVIIGQCCSCYYHHRLHIPANVH